MVLDASTGLTKGATPKPGDFTVCGDCAETLRFGEGLKLSIATDADFAETDEKLRRDLWIARSVVRKRNRRR